MPKTNNKESKPKDTNNKEDEINNSRLFHLLAAEESVDKTENHYHVISEGIICDTNDRGYATPSGQSPLDIVLDASDGFIPLWAKDSTLRWRFQERSLDEMKNPESVRTEIIQLLAEAVLAWGDAAPVRFTYQYDAWDFEIVVKNADNCRPSGCVLASAFFPDAGRHEMVIYPKMFTQSRKEQVDTLIHEIGHVFGLRHFFAQIHETPWASEIFGAHNPFSIMNYGPLSELTPTDKSDLKRLYQLAWSGALTHINGTPIRFFRPYHTTGELLESTVTVAQTQTILHPQSTVTYDNGA